MTPLANTRKQIISTAQEFPSLVSCEMTERLRSEALSGVRALPKIGLEIGGLLTKSSGARDGSSVIDGFESVPSEYRYGPFYRLSPADRKVCIGKAREIQNSGTREIAGFFRSCTRESFEVTFEDIDIVRDVLGAAVPIFLMKPHQDGTTTLRLFHPGEGQTWPHWDEIVSGESAHAIRHAEPCNEIALFPQNFPSVDQRAVGASHQRAVSRKGLFWSVALIALVAGAAYLGPMIMKPRTALAVPDLGLRAEWQERELRLRWNRGLPAIQHSPGGTLQIDDGPQHREISLDSAQIASGSFGYVPTSSNVTFRLRLRGDQNAESVVQILASNPGATTASESRAEKISQATKVPIAKLPLPRVVERTLQPAVKRNAASHRKNAGAKVTVAQGITPASTLPATAPAHPLMGSKVPEGSSPGNIVPHVPQGAPSSPVSPPRTRDIPVHAPEVPAVVSQQPAAPAPAISVPPRPLKKVIPSRSLLGGHFLNSAITIQVQVTVDAGGRVADAHALPDSSREHSYLSDQAVAVAKQWTFEPAKLRGRSVPSQYTIIFNFAASGAAQ